ncbi:MAG TPA: Bax inhibitor-1/YccA family protein [bacterium]|nr:Bax inhibitor-1/YccA family protein [bacterium]
MAEYSGMLTKAVEKQRTFVNRVYGWMCIGLLVTGLTAMYIVSNESLIKSIFRNSPLVLGLILAELGLVIVLSAAINKMSASLATTLFVVYAALSGVTLSVVFLLYTAGSIAMTFYVTAGTFGILAVYGSVTKTDLTSVGNLCFMLLVGLIIASFVNFFLRSSALYWVSTYLGIFIFVGLTAYDAQKIKGMSLAADQADDETLQKGAIIGALALYLDFINLFLLLLRLFGRRR